MIPFSWLRTCKGRLLALTIGCVFFFCFTANYHSTISFLPNELNDNSQLLRPAGISPSIRHHPFENTCKFPIINSYPSDISNWQFAERLRTLKCVNDFPLATMDSDGAIYIHPHYAQYPLKKENHLCKVLIMEGALRNKMTNRGKDDVKIVAELNVFENTRFFVNADIFSISCSDTKTKAIVWEKPFAGMYDSRQPKNTIIPAPDTPNFNNFGERRKIKKALAPERLSIDILGFDSTSRSMFQRHMPKSWETMHRLGFEVLYGYNKVGDNSMVNLAPILIGDVKEAIESPKLDSSGDINADWLLPATKRLDPTNLKFIWKIMKEKYGCKSMLNEDISNKNLGLFHYPPMEFQPGFTEPPADHFYRAYYLNVYKNWTYGPCKNGAQIQQEFVDLWYRFAKNYKDICHFGFTFVTTLTHEQAFLLEPLDEHISQRLEDLNANGVLDNSLSIIMGDHGNRIGIIQYSYSGRIEERMPLMAIRIPPKIREKYPEQYKKFQENRHKLTSNFDIHQLLVDFSEMKFGEERELPKTRGISLFREIPQTRTCFDAYIPENFCSCLVNRSSLKEPIAGREMPTQKNIAKKSSVAIEKWLKSEGLSNCVLNFSLPESASFTIIGSNPLVRHGLRTKINSTVVDAAKNKNPPKMEFLWHEVTVPFSLKSTPPSQLKLLFRMENNLHQNSISVSYEPAILLPPFTCPYKSLFDVCECLGLL